jgi:hypothetical protein
MVAAPMQAGDDKRFPSLLPGTAVRRRKTLTAVFRRCSPTVALIVR